MKNSDQRQPFTEGDRQIFQELYQKHHRLVYAICLRMTQNIPEAEDLVTRREVSEDVYEDRRTFRAKPSSMEALK